MNRIDSSQSLPELAPEIIGGDPVFDSFFCIGELEIDAGAEHMSPLMKDMRTLKQDDIILGPYSGNKGTEATKKFRAYLKNLKGNPLFINTWRDLHGDKHVETREALVRFTIEAFLKTNPDYAFKRKISGELVYAERDYVINRVDDRIRQLKA